MLTRTTRPLPVVSLLILAMGVGCAGRERTPDEILEDGALAYHAGVYLEGASPGIVPQEAAEPGVGEEGPAGGGATPEDATTPEGATAEGEDATAAASEPPRRPRSGRKRVEFRMSDDELLGQVVAALEAEPDLFSRVTPVRASSRQEAIAAGREQGVDVLLVLGFRTAREYRDYERPLGWASLEVVCWLFGGIPAWFVPTVTYETSARLTVEGIELGKSSRGEETASPDGTGPDDPGLDLTPVDWRGVAEVPTENVSLWDRSHPFDRPMDYVTTIFVPPMVLPRGDPDRLAEELTADVTDDLGEALRQTIRDRMLEQEVRGLLSAVFVSPETGSLVEANSVRPRIAVSNRGGGRIEAVEIRRISDSGDSFLWQASASDLEDLSARMRARARPVDYAIHDLPVDVPLESGENLVKLKVLREDDEVLTRTAVYFR